MKIEVCDALCGAGKTVASINMMNADTTSKFLFITPYLSEVERITNACADRKFISPERTYPLNKKDDITALMVEGRNIASTHALFSKFTSEMKDIVRQQEYILILDEAIDLFDRLNVSNHDVDILESSKTIQTNSAGEIEWMSEDYDEGFFLDMQEVSKSHTLVRYSKGFYFWQLPIDIFTCFKKVMVLTYMFEYQPLWYYLKAHGLTYEPIGVKQDSATYNFCPAHEMDRSRDLRSLINIVYRNKYNDLGSKNFSLSSTWYKREAKKGQEGKIPLVKKQIRNVMSYWLNAKAEDVMWTTFIEQRGRLRGKGYVTNFVAFNMKATNDYADRHHLAYCINLYMQPWMKNYLTRIGAVDVNEDMYALSLLIQWIYRSAIRKGEKIWIYIPSARMRYLLSEWIENLYKGEDLKEIRYVS